MAYQVPCQQVIPLLHRGGVARQPGLERDAAVLLRVGGYGGGGDERARAVVVAREAGASSHSSTFQLTGAKAEAWCLLIHADASLSPSHTFSAQRKHF